MRILPASKPSAVAPASVESAAIKTVEADSDATEPPPATPVRPRVRERVRAWIEKLQGDPDAEERTAEERRQRLLDHLSRTVAEAPDDRPIREVISQLNRHWDD